MQAGDWVKYKPEPRPVVICPHCEETSESWGEDDLLKSCNGRIGLIKRIIDPTLEVPDVKCGHCAKFSPPPEHIRELGIEVRFIEKYYPIGVWAYPTELTIVTPPPRRKWRRWMRQEASVGV